MGNLNKNESGFGAVETILVLVIVVLIGVVGYMVYKNHHKSTTTAATAPVSSSNKSDTAPKPTQQPSNETAQAAATRAATIANGLFQAVDKNPTTQESPATYVDGNVSNGYFTPGFKTAVDDGTAFPQGVACTNNFPDSLGAGKATLNGDAATVLLTFIANGSDVTSNYSSVPQVTLQYVNGDWSINGYTCIANPSQS